jgi:hypothetical protein
MFRYFLGVALGLGLVGPASAASWADGMFTELSKDFGTVPIGPPVSHPFHLKNNTGQTVHISSVRVSCGCTTATALESTLAPGQSTAVTASMDTNRFNGVKTVTIFVTFDQPVSEEVRLWVTANGRSDVSVSPEAFQFGLVKRGATPSSTINVSFLGNNQWQVTGLNSESNYVQTSVRETRRDAAEVDYQLTAKLRADAPVGKWYTDIWLKTNNPATPRVRVPFTVEIESALSVTPGLVDLGQVKAGGKAERKVIVRGVKPFRITEIKGTDDVLAVNETGSDSKPVHVLAVTLSAGSAGDFKRKLQIVTDLDEQAEIEFGTRAQIMP